MALKCGIIGLPNIGKSTLFNAITKSNAQSANYPFCTISPNISIVNVPDERLEMLSKMYKTKIKTPANYEFVDIAGLVKGASKGEGLGNKFLSHIKEVDAIAHIVRCFENSNITHIHGKINPIEDINIIQLELILSDLEFVEKHLKKLNILMKSKNKNISFEYGLMKKVYESLQNEIPVKSISLTEKEKKYLKILNLLTLKPIIYIANIDDSSLKNINSFKFIKELEYIAKKEDAKVISISAKIESEITKLSLEEKKEFLQTFGLESSGTEKIIKTTYDILNLITYFTAGKKECKAWTIKKGTKAPKAASLIHTDFERGFIKAEIISYSDLIFYGSELKAKEYGKLKIEGKNYIVKDGDVINFRFNI